MCLNSHRAFHINNISRFYVVSHTVVICFKRQAAIADDEQIDRQMLIPTDRLIAWKHIFRAMKVKGCINPMECMHI